MNRLLAIAFALLVQACSDSSTNSNSSIPDVSAGRLAPADFETLHVVILYGQSLSLGAKGTDLISTSAPYDNDVLMFDGDATIDVRMGLATLSKEFEILDPEKLTGFQNLRAKLGQGVGQRGETIAESLGHSLARTARDEGGRWHGLFFSAGIGGEDYKGIKKGTGPYNNLLVALIKAKAIAEEQGLKVKVDAVAFIHGESDSKNDGYYDALIEIQADLDLDIRGITGQEDSVVLLMNQPSSFYSSGRYAAKAIYDAHKNSDLHILVAPNYDLDFTDDLLHLTSEGYFMLGERFYNAFIETIWKRSSWEPLAPNSIIRDAEKIVVQYNVPIGEIEIDTMSLVDDGQFGFEFYNDIDGEITISSIVKSGGNELTMALAYAPEGGNSVLRYGLTGHNGFRSAETVPHGNIRDSSIQVSRYQNKPLHNWGVHFEEAVF